MAPFIRGNLTEINYDEFTVQIRWRSDNIWEKRLVFKGISSSAKWKKAAPHIKKRNQRRLSEREETEIQKLAIIYTGQTVAL